MVNNSIEEFYKQINSQIYKMILNKSSLSDICILIHPDEDDKVKQGIEDLLIDFSIPILNFIESYHCPNGNIVVMDKNFLTGRGRI